MIWRKPKTPGFGISRNFYMTVLAARAALPPPVTVANPKGEGGAIPGYIIPLASGATKDDLTRPFVRGMYGVSSLDRKTVLRMLIMSKEEVDFDPTAFLRSERAFGLSRELLARMSATWSLLQFTVESHDPMVYDAVKFMLWITRRFADLTDGVVSDPICQTYKLPDDVFVRNPMDPRIDARDVVRVWMHPSDAVRAQEHHKAGPIAAYTLGMQKFDQAEVEMADFDPRHSGIAEAFLYRLAQDALLGDLYGVGDKVGGDACLLDVVPGGLDRARWEGIPCVELIPPTGRSMDDALLAWAAEVGI